MTIIKFGNILYSCPVLSYRISKFIEICKRGYEISCEGNINTLTEALSTAQALHAGTIKGQLIEQSERSDSKSEEVAIVEEQPKHWWQKLFRKK